MTRLIVRDIATERGLNISTFARRAELAYTTAHSLWHDSALVWDRRTLDRTARALGVRVSDLFKEDQDAIPTN